MTSKNLFDLLFNDADSKIVLSVLQDVSTFQEAKKLQEQIVDDCCGPIVQQDPNVIETRRAQAKNLFQKGRHSACLDIYYDLLKDAPFDHKLYTNIAICYAKIDDEKRAIVNASVAARYLDNTWMKAHHRITMSYAHLGYVQLALSYLDSIEDCISDTDRDFIDEQIENERSRSANQLAKVADNEDFDQTVAQLKGPDLSDDNLLFLLYHCLYHFSTGSYSPNVQASVEIIDKVPQLGEIARCSSFNLASFSPQKQHILLAYVSFVAEYAKLSDKFAEKVVKKPLFIGFIVKLGQFFTTTIGIKNTLLARPFGQFTFGNFVKLLVALVGQKVAMKQFLLKTAPFNMFEFHGKLSLAAFCILPLQPPDSSRHHQDKPPEFNFDCVPFLLSQLAFDDEFLLQFDDIARQSGFEAAFATLSVISCFDFQTMDFPSCSVITWSNLSKFQKTASFCIKRPGIWTYAIRRLYRFGDDAFFCEPSSEEILVTLSIIFDLLEKLVSSGGDVGELFLEPSCWNAESNAPMLIKSLAMLAKASHANLRHLHEEEIRKIANLCFLIAAHFCSRSNVFFQEFAKNDFLIPLAVNFLLKQSPTAKIAMPGVLFYLSVASDAPNCTLWRNRLLMNAQFKELIRRVVAFSLSSSNDGKIRTNAILFLYHILSVNDRCKNAAFQALSQSDGEALVRMLVAAIRQQERDVATSTAFYNRIFSVSAGLLLSVLVKSDERLCLFEEEIRNPNEEPVDTAYQRVLKVAKSISSSSQNIE